MRRPLTLILPLICAFGANAQKDSVAIEKDTTIYTAVEKMPEFPGGFDSLRTYLKKERTYPKEDSLNGIEGAVLVYFVIETDGSVSNVKTVAHPDYESTIAMKTEALRIVRAMPDWSPALQLGEPVRVKFQMPIRFLLY